MATVKIGDRDLQVRKATLGLLKGLLPAKRKLREAETADDDAGRVDAVAELVLAYVGEPLNEGVTTQWLLDNLPMDPEPIIRQLFVESGQKVAEATPAGTAPGEALRQ